MPKKFKIKREVYIGFIIVVIFALFLWGVSFLKNNTLLNRHVSYIGIYDRVNGLLVDNPVLINGLKVGKVKDMGLCPHKANKVYVEIMMLDNVKIPSNSNLIIVSSDILGSKAIEIELGDSETLAKSGDTLSTSPSKSLQEEVNMQVLPIKRKAEQLMSSIDSLITNIQGILNPSTSENLRRSFESIRWTMENIEQTSYNVDTLVLTEKKRMKKIIENIESISGNLKNNNEKLTNIINNFSSISDTLAKEHLSNTIVSLNKTLNNFSQISERINKGKGSLGMLINNDSLYNNLKSSSANLDKLLEDMRLNPKRYVHFSMFGAGAKKNKYTPPKK